MLFTIIKNCPHRRIRISHDGFQIAERAQHMGAVNHGPSSQAHQYVLGVVGHADDLMGHHLANGQYQVKAAVHHAVVYLHPDIPPVPASGHPAAVIAGHCADIYRVLPPVVVTKNVLRYILPEKPYLFFPAHGPVSSHGRHDADIGLHAEPVIQIGGNDAAIGIAAGDIRRNQENPPGFWKSFQHTVQHILRLFGGKLPRLCLCAEFSYVFQHI